MNFEFDDDKNTVIIRATGGVDKAILLSLLEEVVAHEKYRPGMARLWDFRNAYASEMTSQAVLEIVRHVAGLGPEYSDAKVVFVAAGALEFGLSRMFEAYVKDEDSRIGVFSTLEEAEAWLAE